MGDPIVMPPLVIGGRAFPNVFTFPKNRIDDPTGNVLLVANLWNFKINDARPRGDHDLWLGQVAARFLTTQPASGARLVGLASRSGSDLYNMKLSMARAENVGISLRLFSFAIDFLHDPGPVPRISVGAQGEQFARSVGAKDGTEDARWRSVLVTIVADRTKTTPVKLLPA